MAGKFYIKRILGNDDYDDNDYDDDDCHDNCEEFISLLPSTIQQHGKEIFDRLKDNDIGESILRKYIRGSLKFVL